MSSGGEHAKIDTSSKTHNEEELSNLSAILGIEIPRARLIQILEASSSLEHAIEIYFYQKQEHEIERTKEHSDTTDVNGKCEGSPIITSVEVGDSSETIVGPHRSHRRETIYLDDDSDNDFKSIVSKKRSLNKMPYPDNTTKKAAAKQARLDSFFRADSSKAIAVAVGPPPCMGAKEDQKAGVAIDIKQIQEGIDVPGSDCFESTYATTSQTVATTGGLLSSTRGRPCSSKKSCTPVLGRIEPTNSGGIDPSDCINSDYMPCDSFRRLCETLQEMTDTTKRLTKLSALETFIREIITHPKTTVRGEESNVSTKSTILSSALELVLGGSTMTPLNVSGSAVSKALQTSLGITRNQISEAYRKNGDLGDCAARFFQKKTHFLINSNARRRLSILQVTKGLHKISKTDGRDAKQHILMTLLRGCQSKIESRFLVRLLIRNMRIGANVKTILAALAMAMIPPNTNGSSDDGHGSSNSPTVLSKIEKKDAITLIQKTHDICPSIPRIVNALLEGGFDQMQRDCSIQVMTPIAPMLAHPIHSLDEIKEKMGGNDGGIATMEWKYDGMRCQAHYDGVHMKLFSRHMLEITDQFHDVVNCLLEAMQVKYRHNCDSFVIDAEIVGVEGEGNESRLLPFQDLSTRRKKMDDGNGIKVKVFAFDLMFLNGESFINEQLFTRRNTLYDLFKETGDFSFVSYQKLTRYDETRIKSYLSEAIEGGAEGLMMKLLGEKSDLLTNQGNITTRKVPEGITSFYEAGTRSHCWLKVKRDYVAGYSDTIDVVPIGAWWGSGRKAQKSFLSPVLLAVYDDEEDVYRSICRCMSFTDAMYESIREFYFHGVLYPSCLDSGVLQNSCTNIQQRDTTTVRKSINEENSSDGHGNDKEDYDDYHQNADSSDTKKEEENENEGLSEVSSSRVNCFSGRPSSAFVITNESPPIWFQPMEVFEVAFADLSLSRKHTAAAGLVDEEGRGVALRFPRFKRRRPDKRPEQATTSVEIAQLFAKQVKIKNGYRVLKPNPSSII